MTLLCRNQPQATSTIPRNYRGNQSSSNNLSPNSSSRNSPHNFSSLPRSHSLLNPPPHEYAAPNKTTKPVVRKKSFAKNDYKDPPSKGDVCKPVPRQENVQRNVQQSTISRFLCLSGTAQQEERGPRRRDSGESITVSWSSSDEERVEFSDMRALDTHGLERAEEASVFSEGHYSIPECFKKEPSREAPLYSQSTKPRQTSPSNQLSPALPHLASKLAPSATPDFYNSSPRTFDMSTVHETLVLNTETFNSDMYKEAVFTPPHPTVAKSKDRRGSKGSLSKEQTKTRIPFIKCCDADSPQVYYYNLTLNIYKFTLSVV